MMHTRSLKFDAIQKCDEEWHQTVQNRIERALQQEYIEVFGFTRQMVGGSFALTWIVEDGFLVARVYSNNRVDLVAVNRFTSSIDNVEKALEEYICDE